MFVRAYPGPDGQTVVDVGGLARSDPAGGFDEEFTGLARALGESYRSSTEASPDPGSPRYHRDPVPTATTEGKSD